MQQWSEESLEELNFCFETTDRQVSFASSEDVHELTDVITLYIQYCEDTIIPVKTVRVFSNNKPWLTEELKKCLKGDIARVKNKDKEFITKVRIAKINFKKRVEPQQQIC